MIVNIVRSTMPGEFGVVNKNWEPGLPVFSAFQRSVALRSRLSGVPIGPKLEKGSEGWLCVGGEEGRLLGLEEWGDWLAGVEWSDGEQRQMSY